MNILVVSQHYYPENFRITDICETLVKRGHKVTVICGYPNYPEGEIYPDYKGKNKKKHKREIVNGVQLYRCNEIPRGHSKIKLFLNYYSVCFSMKRTAKRIKDKFDCIFINQTSPVMVGWAGIAYAKKHNIPSILYCYDLWPASLAAGGVKKTSFIYSHYTKVSKKIYQNVDHICVTSKNFVGYLNELHGVDKQNISYLPQYCEDLFGNIENKLHNGYVFTFAGNIGKMQSIETIVKAASLIKDRKDICIQIVGDGSDLTNCKELAKNLDTTNVEFLGRRPIEEMPEIYANSDAMIVTLAKDELVSKTLPGKVQSYMAAGKVIIAAIDGETKEIMEEANCGYCTEAENIERLANSFRIFSTKDKMIFAKNSRIYYQNHFDKQVFFNSLDNIINKLMK